MKVQIAKTEKQFLDKGMFGIFFEDINYGADGGLYAEMIENRQFAFQKAAIAGERIYETTMDSTYGWETVGDAKWEISTTEPLAEENPHYLRMQVTAGSGLRNKAYDGIYMEPQKEYEVVVYLRKIAGVKNASVVIEDVTASFSLCDSAEWEKYSLTLKSEKEVRNGRFSLVFEENGTVDVGFVSMMPKDAVAGVFRKDLYEMLYELQPGFLRFPGGCIVEGANLSNRYQWKDTVGEAIHRKWNWNRWAVHEPFIDGEKLPFFSWYNQSYGIGFYEYFLLSEMLGANAVPVLSVGLACQYQSYELVPIDTPEFETYVQDALDLIEFANGDVNTKWGGLRAQMGHPESFGLRYLAIGNEQWETDKVDFFARYQRFEKAIHEKYPKIELLGSVGPDVISEHYTEGWNFYREEIQKNDRFVTAVDEHYYMSPKWFLENSHFYDNYPRDIAVFAGEYAAHNEAKSNNWESALTEAAFMTGLERNADVIQLASAAPLFARYGYTQWQPDLIWFDEKEAVATPNYYVQKLYGVYTGETICDVALSDCEAEVNMDRVYISASCDDKNCYVKVANVTEQALNLDFDFADSGITLTERIDLTAPDMDAKNGIGEERIAPKQSALDKAVSQTIEANSFAVFVGAICK